MQKGLVVHIIIAALFLMEIMGSGCHHSSTKEKIVFTPTVAVDTLAQHIGGSDTVFIIPGKSAGNIQLNQLDTGLYHFLGKADSGDAAMCKSWAMWFEKGADDQQEELDIYSACDPKVNMRKTIQQIRLANMSFMLQNGINDSSSLSAIKSKYPQASLSGALNIVGKNKKLFLLDADQQGVAFEFTANDQDTVSDQSIVHAVVVYLPGKSVVNLYLPFYQQ